jgi:hypothetical protein
MPGHTLYGPSHGPPPPPFDAEPCSTGVGLRPLGLGTDV